MIRILKLEQAKNIQFVNFLYFELLTQTMDFQQLQTRSSRILNYMDMN